MADIPSPNQPLPGPNELIREPNKGRESHHGLKNFVADNMAGPASKPMDGKATDIVPNSSSVELTPGQINGLGYQNQDIARNEIFARHGYFFTREDLRDRFMAEGYKPDPRNNPVLNPRFDTATLGLNTTEQKNIDALLKAQTCLKPEVLSGKLATINAVEKTDDTRLVGHQPLDPKQMAQLNPDELRYMRNEIAAGGGFYNWEDPKNLAAFSNKTWYTPGKDTRTSDEIKVDVANTGMLFKVEMQKRYPQMFQS